MGEVFIICLIQILVNVFIRYYIKVERIKKVLLPGIFLILLLISILPIIRIVNILVESGPFDAVSFSGAPSVFILPIVIIVIHFFIHIVWKLIATDD